MLLHRFAVVSIVVLFAFSTVCIIGDAHAEFDKSGTYVCNPFNVGLETNIYTSTVNKINYQLYSYLLSHPNATLQQQHDVIVQDQNTWNLYDKSKQCIDSLGVDPNKVGPLSYEVNQALAIPEFGSIAGMITVMAIIGVVIISRKTGTFRKFGY